MISPQTPAHELEKLKATERAVVSGQPIPEETYFKTQCICGIYFKNHYCTPDYGFPSTRFEMSVEFMSVAQISISCFRMIELGPWQYLKSLLLSHRRCCLICRDLSGMQLT
jgi:hypothetical protein